MKIKYFYYHDEDRNHFAFQNSYLRYDLVHELANKDFASVNDPCHSHSRLYLNGNNERKQYEVLIGLPKYFDIFKSIEAIDKFNSEA